MLTGGKSFVANSSRKLGFSGGGEVCLAGFFCSFGCDSSASLGGYGGSELLAWLLVGVLSSASS
eukprot:523610-Lingulodinium_polyedra.AAC.1